MGTYLALINGFPRGQVATVTLPAIYDQRLTVVAGTAANTNQIQGPVTSGTSVTLPQSGSYTGNELEIYFNGQRLEAVADYAYVGTGSGKTQVQFTFGLVVGDVLDFVILRGP